MKLSTFERLQLLQILPAEGNFLTLKIVRELREALSFTEEEHKVLDFKHGGETFIINGKEMTVPQGQVRWNDALLEKEIPIGNKGKEVITKSLKKLDESEKLTEAFYSLYEKFIEE